MIRSEPGERAPGVDASPAQRGRRLRRVPSRRPRHWLASLFGIVPEGALRRRPTDLLRAGAAAVVVALMALAARDVSALEKSVYDFLAGLPGDLDRVWELGYEIVLPATLVAVAVAAVVARRWRFALSLVCASALAFGVAFLIEQAVGTTAADAMTGAGIDVSAGAPEFPPIFMATVMAGLLAAVAYLTKPVRHAVHFVVLWAIVSAVVLLEGTPAGVTAGLVVALGAASLVQLALGTPAGTPALGEVAQALGDLGIEFDDLQFVEERDVGESRFRARSDDEQIVVSVIGRDATNARLFSKLTRFVWYKDSGPSPRLSRAGQVEHRAYLDLLAAHVGATVPDVVAAGAAGDVGDALIVTVDPPGRPLSALAPDEVTDDVLDDAWANLGRLHGAGLAHGNVHAANVIVSSDHRTGLVDLVRTTSSAPVEQMQRDSAALLTATASVVGAERAVAAAARSLGTGGLADVLPVLQLRALSRDARRETPHAKELVGALRSGAAAYLGADPPELAELQRVSTGNLLMAAGAILGVYLLLGELASAQGVSSVVESPIWGWVLVTFVIAQTPQFSSAVAMLGSVSSPLPLGPVTGVQFANNFTGFVGGTVATVGLVVRFFQKQGLGSAVAVSSGVLNTMAAIVTQTILVVVGLLFTAGDWQLGGGDTDSDSGSSASTAAVIIVLAGIALAVVILVPKLRRQVVDKLRPHVAKARENLRTISGTPRKLVQLFLGNAGAQILFALTLEAALLAYGYSLPLLQLVVINSFASILGGIMPVPGGLGVIEAGLIAGFTAAGVPQDTAIAATFTARMFTAYLPPIWGWFSLRWLQTHDYV